MLFYGRRGNLPDSALLHPGYNNDVLYSSLRGTKQSTVVKFTTPRLPRFARNDGK